MKKKICIVVSSMMTVKVFLLDHIEIYFVNEPIPLSNLIADMSKVLGVKVPREFPMLLVSIAEKVLRKTGRFSSLYNYTTFRMDKLSDLGFTLPFGYREGVRRTVEWYRGESLA